MNWVTRISPIHVGDDIAYAKRFLQSIGCHLGDMAFARGKVTALEPVGDLILARINWDTSGLPDRVNVKNLSLVKNGVVMEHG